MKKVLSKKLRANENYSVNLERLEDVLSQHPDYKYYQHALEGDEKKSQGLRVILQ